MKKRFFIVCSGFLSIVISINCFSQQKLTPEFKVGIAKVSINPDTSLINNNKIWLAGFMKRRTATGIHDTLWVNAMVFDNGQKKVCLIVIDAIGLMRDDVVDIRNRIDGAHLGINHVIISSTHTHSAPDLIGFSGPNPLKSGVNQGYLNFVKQKCVQATKDALNNEQFAYLKFSIIDKIPEDIVVDERPPIIIDKSIYLMQIVDRKTNKPFGILMNFGIHPHALDAENALITSDFCHYWRKGIENGIVYNNKLIREGIGATAIFANGAMGGHITTHDSNTYDPWLDTNFTKSGFEKSMTIGNKLADIVLQEIQEGNWAIVNNPEIRFQERKFLLEIQNKRMIGIDTLGIINRKFIDSKFIETEISLLTIGPAWILTIPGEIYPETLIGGIENPDGADFTENPVEVPPIRHLMSGEYNFVIGLANDAIGYIIPKTLWDKDAPYAFGKPFHEEETSIGPDASSKIYSEIKKMIEEYNYINSGR